MPLQLGDGDLFRCFSLAFPSLAFVAMLVEDKVSMLMLHYVAVPVVNGKYEMGPSERWTIERSEVREGRK